MSRARTAGLLPLLLTVLLPWLADRAEAQGSVAGDKAALVALYDATAGAQWTTSTNWKGDEALSSWHGVTTDGDGRVTALALNGNGLSGTLPSALGDLSALETLDLGDNALRGALPSELADLSALASLSLERSRALNGALPAGLADLSSLTTVKIQDTELCAPEDSDFRTWLNTITFSGLICPPAAQSVIDVAVFYTPAARRGVGSKQGIENRIQLWVAEANRAFRESGVNLRVSVVALQETKYSEDYFSIDLRRVRTVGDGYMDEVHAIRDNVAADVVLLVKAERTDQSGDAYIMGDVSLSFAEYAFGVVAWDADGLTVAHQLGHILGLEHDRFIACTSAGCGDPAFPYAYGATSLEGRFYTIMAWPRYCYEAGVKCTRAARFSDPQRTYRGRSLGAAGLAPPPPERQVWGPADAVRALDRTRGYVERFRQAPDITVSFDAASYTAAEGGSAATVTVRLSAAPSARSTSR